MKKKNDSRQHKRLSRMVIILLAVLGGIVLYGATNLDLSDRGAGSIRASYRQPQSTKEAFASPTARPSVRSASKPVACGTLSSPVLQCRFSNGTTVRAAMVASTSSRVRVSVTCGSTPCRFSHRDFELFSGSNGEYPDWDRSHIPEVIAPNRTTTLTLKYRRFIGNDSVLRFNAFGYVDAWLKL